MDKEQLVGTIIWAICCFGCAFLFLGIGIWADKSSKPVHFWSGTTIGPSQVSDLKGYNHATAVMWKVYSAPYFLSAILGCLESVRHEFMIVAIVLLFTTCFPGSLLLVWRYIKIEKTYILR